MIQLLIALFGLTAIYFAMGNNPELRKWAPLIRLAWTDGERFELVGYFETRLEWEAELMMCNLQEQHPGLMFWQHKGESIWNTMA